MVEVNPPARNSAMLLEIVRTPTHSDDEILVRGAPALRIFRANSFRWTLRLSPPLLAQT